MRFLEIINEKKFTFISIFLFLYVILNLFDGERGLISYYEKQRVKNELQQKQKSITAQLEIFKNKNYLLSESVDLDFLETLYREKFMVGKLKEKIYINYNNDN